MSKEKEASRPTASVEPSLANQVTCYFSAPCIAMSENPCVWWKENQHVYNLIAAVARRYLGIPATEVESERIFSTSGNVVSERRRSLNQEHISELVFLHQNL